MNKFICGTLTSVLLACLVGCISVDDMLISSDPDQRRRGEEYALKYINNEYGKIDSKRKIELVEKIESHDILFKAYLSKHIDDNVRQAVKARIPPEKISDFKKKIAEKQKQIEKEQAEKQRRLLSQKKVELFATSPDPKTRQAALDEITQKEDFAKALYLLAKKNTPASDNDVTSLLKKIGDNKLISEQLVQILDKHFRSDGNKEAALKSWARIVRIWQNNILTPANDFQSLDSLVDDRGYSAVYNAGGYYQSELSELHEEFRKASWAIRLKARESLREKGKAIARQRNEEAISYAENRIAELMSIVEKNIPPSDTITKLKEKAAKKVGNTQLVIKGFYLNMPIDDALQLFRAYTFDPKKVENAPQFEKSYWYEEEWSSISVDGKGLESQSVKFLVPKEHNITNEAMSILGNAYPFDISKDKRVTRIIFDRDIVDTLFDVAGVDGKIICKQLVDNYPIIKELKYSSIEIDDDAAREEAMNRAAWNILQAGGSTANMYNNAFSAGLNSPKYKKWIECYHYESTEGFRVRVRPTEKKAFLVIEKTQKVEKKNFD